MNNVNITKLLFIRTGSYHDMVIRPYTSHLTGGHLNDLETATKGFSNFSITSLSGIAGSIIRPSTVDKGSLSIENGWNEPRYMFMMEVVESIESFNGAMSDSLRVKYITGYTDRLGDLSFNNHIDPTMRLYIANVVYTSEVTNAHGRHRRGIEANHFIQSSVGQPTSYGQQGFYSLRPKDVCNAAGNLSFTDYDVYDFRNSLSAQPITSRIANDLPTDYLSRTFDSYKQAINDVNVADEDVAGLLNNVGEKTGDEAGIADPFIKNLQLNTSLTEGSSFTYGEFCNLFPGVDDIAIISDTSKAVENYSTDVGFGLHQPNDTERWSGSKNETIAASIVSSAVPALMTSVLLTQVAFNISNDTVNGETAFEWVSPPNSFMNTGDLSRYSEMFKDRMIHEVFKDLTRNGNITISLGIFADLVMSDVRMNISVDGGYATPYCLPSFAGSLTSPVITNSRDELDSLAENVTGIFEEMSSKSLDPRTMERYSPNPRLSVHQSMPQNFSGMDSIGGGYNPNQGGSNYGGLI